MTRWKGYGTFAVISSARGRAKNREPEKPRQPYILLAVSFKAWRQHGTRQCSEASAKCGKTGPTFWRISYSASFSGDFSVLMSSLTARRLAISVSITRGRMPRSSAESGS